MEIKVKPETFFVFDLDDTLYTELDFLKSAYRHISKKLFSAIDRDVYNEMLQKYENDENVFEWLLKEYQKYLPDKDVNWFLNEYRQHEPEIEMSESTDDFLKKIKKFPIPAGLITDGRSISQRNKLKALKLENFFCDVIISEEFGFAKPNEKNYLFFEKKYPGREFYFFGDNLVKDFIVPEKLGWNTVCLKDAGNNIHKQIFNGKPILGKIISSFSEISLISA